MSEADKESKPGAFPPVPAGAPSGAGAGREEDLAATSISGKGPAPAEPAAAEADDDLEATSIGVKIREIQGLKLVRELGRGAAGVVYHGKQEFLDREVAVKMLLEQRKNPEYTARFKREAKLLAGLQHAHIVGCYQADVTPDGVCFLVMEFVNGPNLREHLVDKGPLDVVDAVRVCRDLASALECAYEKTIIHRDVKSENVLLANEPRAPKGTKFPYRAKLSDLGLARPAVNEEGTNTSLHLTVGATIMGTPLNMSPEQFDDPQGVDHRTDIYSLGCVLYDMLVAKPAFLERTLSKLVIAKNAAVRGPDPRLQRPDVDPGVSELVMRMIAAKREDRPQTYAELIATCDRLLEQLGGTRAPVPARSRAGLYAGVGALVLAVGGGAWWMAAHGGGANDVERPPPVQLALQLEPVTDAEEGRTVMLTATLAGTADSALQLEWKQVGGTTVELGRVGERSASFVAPRATAPYELSFQVSADSAGKRVESAPLTFTVSARDDAPAITIEGATEVRERQLVTLSAKVADPDGHGALEYAWSHTGGFLWSEHSGSALPLEQAKERVSFTAPEAAAPYTLQVSLEVRAGSGRWRAEPVTLQVAAIDDPPVVTLHVPPSAEAGEVVALEAEAKDVDSQGALKFEWRIESPPGLPAAIDDPAALRTRFLAPENAAGDYELGLALLVTDGAQPPRKEQATLAIASDPALNALAPDARVAWVSTVVAAGLPGWAPGPAAPEVSESPDGGVIVTGEQESWISRKLPRGKFALSLKLQPQTAASCGLRLAVDDAHAYSLCFLPREGEDCGLVGFATARADGGWSMPGSEKQRALAPWKLYETLEIELISDGASLKAHWRAPAAASWSALVPIELPSRPRSLSLFVKNGMMLVSDVTIRGS